MLFLLYSIIVFLIFINSTNTHKNQHYSFSTFRFIPSRHTVRSINLTIFKRDKMQLNRKIAIEGPLLYNRSNEIYENFMKKGVITHYNFTLNYSILGVILIRLNRSVVQGGLLFRILCFVLVFCLCLMMVEVIDRNK